MRSIRISGGWWMALAVLAALCVAALGDAARAESRKLALVIGNDAYRFQPALAKAVGDAHAVRDAFEKLGFEVRLAENLDYAGMVGTIADFQSSIAPGDTVAFHFSGHGVAANGHNYLLPVDFPVMESGRQGEVTLPRLGFDAAEIVDGLRSQGAALTLAVFDACRDNALTSGTRSIMSRGLVRMDPPRGVFVMFSAGPGELAADRLSDSDPAPTSVFTRVFLPILETPGLTLVEIAKRTQVQVSELAATVDHQQFPDYSDRVIGDVVLLPPAKDAPAVTPPTPPTPPPQQDLAAVAPEVASPAAQPSVSPIEPFAADAALCDAIAGDPHDPTLPASVERSQLFDLEWMVDLAAPAADSSIDAVRPPLFSRLPEAVRACAAAQLGRPPEERRFAYQYARAVCLSGASDKCSEAIHSIETLDHASAKKFLAFATLSTIDAEGAGGGLAGLLSQMKFNGWLGLPKADLSDSDDLARQVRDLFAAASAGGDREATAFTLLFDEQDHERRAARLQSAADQGLPVGLPAVATFAGLKFKMTPELNTLLTTAVLQGSRFAVIMLLSELEANKTPEALANAKQMLEPLVAAGSPVAASILKKVEAEAEQLTSAPPATAPDQPVPPTPTVSSIDFGDDAGNYASNGECDDRRFVGSGMTTTTLIGDDVLHDASDCRAAFAAGRVALRNPATAAGIAAAAGIHFGDDAGEYANNGVCDDPAFAGPGMTENGVLESDRGHDATDCRTAFEAERIALADGASIPAAPADESLEKLAQTVSASGINFGDDASSYARDGACDDRRFEGSGMTTTGLIGADVLHDATDCLAAYNRGAVTLVSIPTPAGIAAAAPIDFGDDAGTYANDGVCGDQRFQGPGMNEGTLLGSEVLHDATDCRTAFEAERLTLVSIATPAGIAAAAAIDFGDDLGDWARNGVCDDPRFAGPGMTDMGALESDRGHDATDCRTAFEAERLSLR